MWIDMVSFIQRKRRKQGEGCFSGDLMAYTTAIYLVGHVIFWDISFNLFVYFNSLSVCISVGIARFLSF